MIIASKSRAIEAVENAVRLTPIGSWKIVKLNINLDMANAKQIQKT
jgi:hypothetical protein